MEITPSHEIAGWNWASAMLAWVRMLLWASWCAIIENHSPSVGLVGEYGDRTHIPIPTFATLGLVLSPYIGGSPCCRVGSYRRGLGNWHILHFRIASGPMSPCRLCVRSSQLSHSPISPTRPETPPGCSRAEEAGPTPTEWDPTSWSRSWQNQEGMDD